MPFLEWLFFIFLAFYLSLIIFKFRIEETLNILFLVIYHFLFSFAFLKFTEGKTNDSYNYFLWAKDSFELDFQGTGIIIRLVRFLNFIGFDSYSNVFLFFTCISAISIVGFYRLIYKSYYSINIKLTIFLLLLIPGLHFWTVAVGKDSLTLFSMFLICYSANNRKFLLGLLGILILLLVRYHIAGIIMIALSIYFIFFSNYKPKKISRGVFRFSLIGLSLPISVVMFWGLMNNIQKYSSQGFGSFGEFIENRQDVYSDVGSGVLLSGQPYIIKIFALIFGGIPWLSVDALSIFSMLEGLIVLTVFFMCFFLLKKYKNNRNYYYDVSLYFYIFILIFLLFMPLISANLGIMVRMRVIFYLPLFLIFINLLLHIRSVGHINEKISSNS